MGRAIHLLGLLPGLIACGQDPEGDELSAQGGTAAAGAASTVGGQATVGNASGGQSMGGAGTAGTSAPAGAVNAAAPSAYVGEWQMIGWEDPVAVHLVGSLSKGCADGLGALHAYLGYPDPGEQSSLGGICGDVEIGNVQPEQRRLQFLVHLEESPFVPTEGISYGADVFVAESADRMVGYFNSRGWADENSGVITTWLRPEAFEPPALPTLAYDHMSEGCHELHPVDNAQPANMGRLCFTSRAEIRGDFGGFWPTEYSWNTDDLELTVGPVAATLPGVPTQLVLRFETELGIELEASGPDIDTTRYATQPP